MDIQNSNLTDCSSIFELYDFATAYMQSKNRVAWPEFDRDLILNEIYQRRQLKLLIDGRMACVWATALSDPLIWGLEEITPSLYLHRIATHPDFRGQGLAQQVVDWADGYCRKNSLRYVRLDTVGLNQGLIALYTKLGFEFLGAQELEETDGLPEHYKQGPVCLFQRLVPQQ